MSTISSFLLSPLDQHAPKVFTRIALIFPVKDYGTAITNLQSALDKTCEQLPYLKGHVFEEGVSHRKQSFLRLDLVSKPPQFVERPAPPGIPSYQALATNKTPFPPEVFPSPTGPASQEGTQVPVLGASYTKIEGGLVMCIATYHKVIDGTGYSEILKVLAANSRGDGVDLFSSGHAPDSNEIATRRQRILRGNTHVGDDIKRLDLEAILLRHPEYTLKSKMNLDRNISLVSVKGIPQSSAKNTNRVFSFSESKIQEVKDLLEDRLPSGALTVNNILTAIIWASITHVRTTRSQDPLQTSTSKIDSPVNGRRLVGQSLQTPPYIGNAIAYAQAESPISNLSFAPSLHNISRLAPIIKLVADSTAILTPSSLESLVHLSDKNPDLSNITMTWLFNEPEDLHFISWAQVAVYDLDFGTALGKPGHMRSAFMRANGVVNFLPRRRDGDGKGGTDVSIMLREDDMGRLAGNEAWRSWLVGG